MRLNVPLNFRLHRIRTHNTQNNTHTFGRLLSFRRLSTAHPHTHSHTALTLSHMHTLTHTLFSRNYDNPQCIRSSGAHNLSILLYVNFFIIFFFYLSASALFTLHYTFFFFLFFIPIRTVFFYVDHNSRRIKTKK